MTMTEQSRVLSEEECRSFWPHVQIGKRADVCTMSFRHFYRRSPLI